MVRLQAAAQRADTLDGGRGAAGHPDFSLATPTAARAGRQLRRQPMGVPPAVGARLSLVADMILEVDAINPQVAARLVPSLGRWKRFEPARAELMRAELERIVATPG
jgi:aminopeptidase N